MTLSTKLLAGSKPRAFNALRTLNCGTSVLNSRVTSITARLPYRSSGLEKPSRWRWYSTLPPRAQSATAHRRPHHRKRCGAGCAARAAPANDLIARHLSAVTGIQRVPGDLGDPEKIFAQFRNRNFVKNRCADPVDREDARGSFGLRGDDLVVCNFRLNALRANGASNKTHEYPGAGSLHRVISGQYKPQP